MVKLRVKKGFKKDRDMSNCVNQLFQITGSHKKKKSMTMKVTTEIYLD